jgi:hypothetical protein
LLLHSPEKEALIVGYLTTLGLYQPHNLFDVVNFERMSMFGEPEMLERM